MTTEEKLQNIIKDLKEENLKLHEKLKFLIEEEQLSSNQKLLSELSIKNEEILSQNEEIRAINEELVATNEALKESEQYLSQILDESLDAIFHLDKTGKIFYVNKSALLLSAYSHEELLNLNFSKLFTEKSLKKEALRYDLVEDGQIVIRERKLINKSGKEIPVELRSKILPHGEIQTLIRDLTEQYKGKQLNTYFQKIFTQSPDGIFQIDKNGIIINCNKAFADSVALSIHETIGKHAADFIVDKPAFKEAFKKLVNEGYTETELRQIKANGELTTVWRRAVALKNELGEFDGAFAFSRDISKRIEQAKLHLKLSTAVEQSANFVIIADREGVIEYVNKKFVEFTGYSREEVVGKHTRMLKSGKHSKQYYENLWKTISSGKQWCGEFHNLKKDGTLYWELATISPVINKFGEIINYIAVKEDITERKKIAKELKRKNKEYELLMQKYELLHEKLLKLNIELEEQSQKYRDIFNVPNDCIFIHDIHTGVVVDINSTVNSLFGYKPEEVIGKTIEDLSAGFFPYDKETAEKNIETALRKGSYTFEWLAKHKNGNLFWVEVNLKLGNIGGIERILATVKDIGERKKQEEKLIESEERFRAIFNNSPDIIILTDAETFRIVSVNDTAFKLTGYKTVEVMGKTIKELNVWVDEHKYYGFVEKVIQNNSFIDNFKAELKRKNGAIFHALISIRPIYLKSKKHYIQIVRDITENIKMERALFESEQKFKELADLSPSGIFIYQDNNFVYVNKATCSITGYSEEELLKMKFWDVVHEDMKDIVRERGQKRIKKEDIINRYELKLRTKNGAVKWIDFSASYIVYKGKPSGIGNVFDITEQKKVQAQLIEAKKKAEESDRLKSAFLANMSHEIRTPMNGIVGFSELLAVGDLPEERKQKYIDIIRKSSDQLLHIINDILDVSKIEVGELQLIKSMINIHEFLLELKSLFAAQIMQSRNSDIELILDDTIPDDKKIFVSDKFRLHQIISNLINNALKFTEEGFVRFGARFVVKNTENIEFSCGKKDYDRLLFFVKDTGMGISKEMQNVIFDRFRQSNDSKTKKYGGTGLGLSIAKGLVNILGGNMWLISEKRKGSVFYFTIPYDNKYS